MTPAALLLLLLSSARAPYARHYEAERSRSALYVAGAIGLAALNYWESGEACDEDGQVESSTRS